MEPEIDTDPRFDLLRDSGRPLPDVLSDKLSELIEAGVYRPGWRLPSEADLTRRWKVARSSLRTDQAFHEAIVMAARNELLLETYQQLVPEIVEWRFDSFAVRGVPLRSGREHEKVVRYLRNNDPGGARVAMNGHLQRLYDELAEIRYEPLDLTQSRPDEEPEWHTRDIHR